MPPTLSTFLSAIGILQDNCLPCFWTDNNLFPYTYMNCIKMIVAGIKYKPSITSTFFFFSPRLVLLRVDWPSSSTGTAASLSRFSLASSYADMSSGQSRLSSGSHVLSSLEVFFNRLVAKSKYYEELRVNEIFYPQSSQLKLIIYLREQFDITCMNLANLD